MRALGWARALTLVIIGAGAMTGIVTVMAGASLVALMSTCDGQTRCTRLNRVQETAMRRLINYAREHSGMHGVGSSHSLERAASRKSGDVMNCGFSHTACGRPADLYAQRYGYTSASSWMWARTWPGGRGERSTPRAIMRAWLHSPPHRETMLTHCSTTPDQRPARQLQRPAQCLPPGCSNRLPRLLSPGAGNAVGEGTRPGGSPPPEDSAVPEEITLNEIQTRMVDESPFDFSDGRACTSTARSAEPRAIAHAGADGPLDGDHAPEPA